MIAGWLLVKPVLVRVLSSVSIPCEMDLLRVTVARYYTPSGRLIQRPYENGNSNDYYAELGMKTMARPTALDVAELPTFETKQGRTVYGGGGITPDYTLNQPRTISRDLARVRRHDFRFFFKWLPNTPQTIPELAEDWEGFLHELSFDDDFVGDVYRSASWKWISKSMKTASNGRRCHQDLSQERACWQALWGRNEEYQIRLSIDNQIQDALSYFSEASQNRPKCRLFLGFLKVGHRESR